MKGINTMIGSYSIRVLFIGFLSFILCANVFAEDNYSIYLVRHAEKQKVKEDPTLTSCGILRAEQIATILQHIDIKTIYSTQYKRTLQTADPIAKQKNLGVKIYPPNHLDQLALRLQQEKTNALVVGHSNTTPQLAQLLADVEVAPLTEQEYQSLYLIQFVGDKKILTLLTQPLTCQ